MIGILVTGCGGSRGPRPAEIPTPDSGKFLTLEEQRMLSRSELEAYCASLNGYLEELRADVRLAQRMTDSLDVVLDSLNTAHGETNRRSRQLERELRQLKSGRQGTTDYLTREGDTLMKLSSLFYGTAANWRKIYDANKERIEDPAQPLRPGLRLRIPQ